MSVYIESIGNPCYAVPDIEAIIISSCTVPQKQPTQHNTINIDIICSSVVKYTVSFFEIHRVQAMTTMISLLA